MTTAPGRWRLLLSSACLAIAAVCASALPGSAWNGASEIVGSRFPALNADGSVLAFSYQGDIWRCNVADGVASRITVHAAYDAYPRWSPDGRWIAFSSNREGGFDVFVAPADGGQPIRLTCHPADDIVCDWAPDGAAVVFSSARSGDEPQIYEINVRTRALRQRTHDPAGARYAVCLRDRGGILYTRGSQAWWRFRYSGPGNADIARSDAVTGDVSVLTTYDGLDGWPMAVPGGGMLYVSSASGVPNVWSCALDGSSRRQLTNYTRGGVWFASASRDGSRVVFERDGHVWLMAVGVPGPAEPTKVAIRAASDRRTDAVKWITRSSGFSDAALAPDGKSMAFALGGRIWTGKLDGGDGEMLTPSAWWARDPCWAPDGKRIAYFDRRDGHAGLYVLDIASRSEMALTADAELQEPVFSPDGRRLAAISRSGSQAGLWVVAADQAAKDSPTGAALVAPGPGVESFAWSPDGRWLAFARRDRLGLSDVWVCPSTGGPSVNVTRGAGDLRVPRWSRDGLSLLCIGEWGTMAGRPESGVFEVLLVPAASRAAAASSAAGQPSPDPAASDEDAGPAAQRRRPVAPGGATRSAQPPAAPVAGWPIGPAVQTAQRVAIDFDGISDRLRLVSSMPSAPRSADWAPDGRTIIVLAGAGSRVALMAIDSRTRATRPMADAEGATVAPLIAADGSFLLWLNGDGALRVLRSGAPAGASVAIACRFQSDVRAAARSTARDTFADLEASTLFPLARREAWRNECRLYEQLTVDAEAAEDARDALLLAIGDAGGDGTDLDMGGGVRPPVAGTLGLDFDLSYDGPGLRVARSLRGGPAHDAPQGVGDGEILHTIEGASPASVEEAYGLLQDRVGRALEIVAGPTPPSMTGEDGPGVRKLSVVPITFESEQELRRTEVARVAERRIADLAGASIVYAGIGRLGDAAGRDIARAVVEALRDGKGLVIDLRQARSDDRLDGVIAACREAAERSADGATAGVRAAIAVIIGHRTSVQGALVAISLRRDFGATVVGDSVWVGHAATRARMLPNGMILRLPAVAGPFAAKPGHVLETDRKVSTAAPTGDVDAQLTAAVKALLEAAAQERGTPVRP